VAATCARRAAAGVSNDGVAEAAAGARYREKRDAVGGAARARLAA